MQECKRLLDGEPLEERVGPEHVPVHVVTVRVPGEGGADQPAEADGRVDEEAPEANAPDDVIHANAGSTNASDDYAHRGDALATMPLYVYRMYVRRVARPSPTKMKCGTLFPFEPHYDLASQYVQEVSLCKINVPTLDGINASVRDQDPEQNSLLKAMLSTPWACKVGIRESVHHHHAGFTSEPGLAYSVSFPGPRKEKPNYTPARGPGWAWPGGGVYLLASHKDPMKCGNACVYAGLLRQGPVRRRVSSGALQPAGGHGGAGQPASSTAPPPPDPGQYTFERAWRLRSSEIAVLAARADAKCDMARKKLVLADVTLFAERKEPLAEIEKGEDAKDTVADWCRTATRRRIPSHAIRAILLFLDLPCAQHPEQCTLAEFSAYVVRDVMSHVELAAEARVKKPRPQLTSEGVISESDTDVDRDHPKERPPVEIEDMGGGHGDDQEAADDEPSLGEVSSFPLADAGKVISMCLQEDELAALTTKNRKSKSDLNMQALEETYSSLAKQDFSDATGTCQTRVRGFGGKSFQLMLSRQKKNIELAKKMQSLAGDDHGIDDSAGHDDDAAGGVTQPAEPKIVPLDMLMQGPKVVALHLAQEAQCTEEQLDAVALLAHSLQRRFEQRPDKTNHKLPVATPDNNHRAIWLGGGGCGKTRTLEKVVQPLAEAYFGPSGYAAAASSNAAAQNLGNKGRTLHGATGLLFGDSLKTAKLRLNAQTQKKMDRLAGDLGVDVIDELGTVPAEMLHADALRKTYGRARRHNLDPTLYMKPEETWGRMPCKLLSGDFYQLPPVPSSASLLASADRQSYEHLQARKLLLDVPYVLEFVNMKRFDDPDLLHILEAMRTKGGKKISDEVWAKLQATVCQKGDRRLLEARGWYECAYEWRRVSFAMHVHARLNAKHSRRVLFYIPAIDRPSTRLTRQDYDDMRASPNIGAAAKCAGVLPVYVGMEIVLTESYLPPQVVRGATGEVVDIQFHQQEPPVAGRPSLQQHSCVVLKYMPVAILVRVDNCTQKFMQDDSGANQPGEPDLTGVVAVTPVSRPWSYKPKGAEHAVSVARTQIPLLPRKQCTLHGVQGKTADPGFIAHWQFPAGLQQQFARLTPHPPTPLRDRPGGLACDFWGLFLETFWSHQEPS